MKRKIHDILMLILIALVLLIVLAPKASAATGWQKIGGTWYYFDRYSGSMFSNKFALIDGKHYAFAPSGAMLTGWYKYTWTSPDEQEVEHTYYAWYYLGTNGDAQIGWLTLSDGKYYLESDGQMVTGEQYIDGKLYKFDTEGRLVGEVTEETNDGDDDDNVVDGGNDVGSIPDFEAEETIVPEETIEEPTEDTETNTIDSEEVETEEVETIEEPVEETDSEGEDVQEDLEQIEEIEPVETAEN